MAKFCWLPAFMLGWLVTGHLVRGMPVLGNTSLTAGQYLRPLGESHAFFTRYRCNTAGQQINDIVNYNYLMAAANAADPKTERNRLGGSGRVGPSRAE